MKKIMIFILAVTMLTITMQANEERPVEMEVTSTDIVKPVKAAMPTEEDINTTKIERELEK